MIIIYTKTHCPYCTRAKRWLAEQDYSYVEISLDDADAREKFRATYPDARTVPQIFVGDDETTLRRIGGYDELLVSDLVKPVAV